MLQVWVRYGRAADVLRDYETQLAHHGLFVRVDPPAGLSQFDPVELEVVFGPYRVKLSGQAVQIAAGVGVAVSFEAAESTKLEPVVTRARTGGNVADADPGYGIGEAPAGTGAPGGAQDGGASTPATKADKIQKALRGTKEERLRIIRDNDRTLHMYVLKNPRIGIDEIATLAKAASTSIDVLKTIGERREWYQRPEIALGLVRNPKTPVPIAVRMLDHISKQELRRLAKSDGARMPILQAARKKVVGPR